MDVPTSGEVPEEDDVVVVAVAEVEVAKWERRW